jgi:hypothetical protein
MKLRASILAHVAKTDDQREIVTRLFDDVPDGAVPPALSASDVIDRMPKPRPTKDGIRALVYRLNRNLERFFAKAAAGRAHAHRVKIHEYRLYFEPNVVEPATNLVEGFWSPYLNSDKPVRILYPEPQFFMDDRFTYLRNPAAATPDRNELFAYLRPEGTLVESYSFVPSGVVRALLFLIEAFTDSGIRFIGSPIRPYMQADHEEDEHIVVLGTPSTTPLITTLETRMPLQVTTAGISRDGVVTYCDDNEEDLTGVKWPLLTRRAHRFTGRLITVISAKHGRTVQALAGFLTRHPDLQVLARHLNVSDAFPREFQTVFEVEMSRAGGEPRIDSIRPVKSNKRG